MFNRAYVEITNVCNLACSFCPVPAARRGICGRRTSGCWRKSSGATRRICTSM